MKAALPDEALTALQNQIITNALVDRVQRALSEMSSATATEAERKAAAASLVNAWFATTIAFPGEIEPALNRRVLRRLTECQTDTTNLVKLAEKLQSRASITPDDKQTLIEYLSCRPTVKS
jgi:hypothetical protein